jgi:putative membrane protein insertion efficiency factor
VRTLILYLLRFYKRYLSPLCPPACRFVPTCSEYATEAFEKKPLLTAAWMTVVRIAKCHPFHPGGYDPVK